MFYEINVTASICDRLTALHMSADKQQVRKRMLIHGERGKQMDERQSESNRKE